MVKDIVRDPLILKRKSLPATAEDRAVAADLLDTLTAHRNECVGMAANMIGVCKRIIVFEEGDRYTVMYNPMIVARSGPYEAEEGCLSLFGTRKTVRYRSIMVRWQDEAFRVKEKRYSGWVAQIIQHEADHLEGILI